LAARYFEQERKKLAGKTHRNNSLCVAVREKAKKREKRKNDTHKYCANARATEKNYKPNLF